MQRELRQGGEPVPNVTKINEELADLKMRKMEIEWEALKNRYARRGPVNDAATCFWILGGSNKELKNIDAAIAAYHQASQYSYGLTWNPNGFFWSAAVDSDERARLLEEGQR